jgi:hypothetical protein
MDLREIGLGRGWIGFDWLRTGTGDGLLWVRWWTFGFLRHGVSFSISERKIISGHNRHVRLSSLADRLFSWIIQIVWPKYSSFSEL